MNCTVNWSAQSVCTFHWIFRFLRSSVPAFSATLVSSAFSSLSALGCSPQFGLIWVCSRASSFLKTNFIYRWSVAFTWPTPHHPSSPYCQLLNPFGPNPPPPIPPLPRTGTRFILNKCKRRVNWQTMKKEKYFCTFLATQPPDFSLPAPEQTENNNNNNNCWWGEAVKAFKLPSCSTAKWPAKWMG